MIRQDFGQINNRHFNFEEWIPMRRAMGAWSPSFAIRFMAFQ